MSDDQRVLGVVVAHGDLAQGLVAAVRSIAGGHADGLAAVSNEGRGPDMLVAAINEVVGGRRALIFADMQAGSCCMAALSSSRDAGERAVVSGVNLPMLLHFVFNRDTAFEELLPRLVEKGREAIRPIQQGR